MTKTQGSSIQYIPEHRGQQFLSRGRQPVWVWRKREDQGLRQRLAAQQGRLSLACCANPL